MFRKRLTNRIASGFNPENCPQFFNKQTLENGITTYWVEESNKGIEAIRNALDSAWGNRSTRPWWAVEKIDFSTGCKVRAAFRNGKIFAVSWTDEFGLRWWDLMNNETRYLPGAFDAEGYSLEGDWLHAMQDPNVTKDKFFDLDFKSYDYDYAGWWKVVLAYRNSATIDILEELAQNMNVLYRKAAASSQQVSPEILEMLCSDADEDVRELVASNKNTAEITLSKLSEDDSWSVRNEVAKNPNTPDDILGMLADDKDRKVRNTARKKLGMTF